MTTDLTYLTLTAMLTAALWIPYIACQVMTNGFLSPENYVDPTPRPVPLWGRRAERAYMNAVDRLCLRRWHFLGSDQLGAGERRQLHRHLRGLQPREGADLALRIGPALCIAMAGRPS